MTRRYTWARSCGGMLVAAVSTCASLPALAAERRIELIPMIGVRGGTNLAADVTATPPAEAGASASFGLTLDISLKADTWFECTLERQTLRFTADPASFGSDRFDVDVDYLHFGAAYGPATGSVRPYVSAAAGLTHFGASGGAMTRSIGLSGSLGGGVQVPLGRRVALRFEVRGYATFSDAAIAVACGAGCSVQFGADGWYQVAARAGLAIRL